MRLKTRLGAVAVLAVATSGGALLALRVSADDPDVALGDPGAGGETAPSPTGAQANPLMTIAVQPDVEEGENIVFTFEAPLPTSPPQPVPGIETLPHELTGIAYTTQRGGPEASIHVCRTRHFGFQPLPPETGSVDVFIPAAWMPPGFDPTDVPIDNGVRPDLEPSGTPGKIVGCGPYNGYVQYSIWSPASDDLEDVNAHLTSSDRLVVEIRP
jgi:hypothetical protein